MKRAAGISIWVAHASSVLVAVSRRNDLFLVLALRSPVGVCEKFAIARTRSPARETRALPQTFATCCACYLFSFPSNQLSASFKSANAVPSIGSLW